MMDAFFIWTNESGWLREDLGWTHNFHEAHEVFDLETANTLAARVTSHTVYVFQLAHSL